MVNVLRRTPPLLAAAVLTLAFAPGAAPRAVQPLSPSVTATCTPAPADCTGWYTTSATLAWSWDAGAVNTFGCDTRTFGADTAGTAVTCRVEYPNVVVTTEVTIKVDKTAPAVTGAAPDRPPDANGWFNHPVSIAFQGADPTSGVAGCSVASYAGPASSSASAVGTCRDVAGNTSAQTPYTFKYDATVPTVRASTSELNRAVLVRWRASANTQRVLVRRIAAEARGAHGQLGARVFEGGGTSFRDRNLRNGVSYLYTVFAISRAGLVGSVKVAATPTPLFAPQPDVRVDRPPTLRWAWVPKATYYNVQLRRNGKKILSAWPTRTFLRLHRRWRFEDQRYRLAPGRYDWYIWPGYGQPTTARYGPLLGHSSFTVEG